MIKKIILFTFILNIISSANAADLHAYMNQFRNQPPQIGHYNAAGYNFTSNLYQHTLTQEQAQQAIPNAVGAINQQTNRQYFLSIRGSLSIEGPIVSPPWNVTFHAWSGFAIGSNNTMQMGIFDQNGIQAVPGSSGMPVGQLGPQAINPHDQHLSPNNAQFNAAANRTFLTFGLAGLVNTKGIAVYQIFINNQNAQRIFQDNLRGNATPIEIINLLNSENFKNTFENQDDKQAINQTVGYLQNIFHINPPEATPNAHPAANNDFDGPELAEALQRSLIDSIAKPINNIIQRFIETPTDTNRAALRNALENRISEFDERTMQLALEALGNNETDEDDLNPNPEPIPNIEPENNDECMICINEFPTDELWSPCPACNTVRLCSSCIASTPNRCVSCRNEQQYQANINTHAPDAIKRAIRVQERENQIKEVENTIENNQLLGLQGMLNDDAFAPLRDNIREQILHWKTAQATLALRRYELQRQRGVDAEEIATLINQTRNVFFQDAGNRANRLWDLAQRMALSTEQFVRFFNQVQTEANRQGTDNVPSIETFASQLTPPPEPNNDFPPAPPIPVPAPAPPEPNNDFPPAPAPPAPTPQENPLCSECLQPITQDCINHISNEEKNDLMRIIAQVTGGRITAEQARETLQEHPNQTFLIIFNGHPFHQEHKNDISRIISSIIRGFRTPEDARSSLNNHANLLHLFNSMYERNN